MNIITCPHCANKEELIDIEDYMFDEDNIFECEKCDTDFLFSVEYDIDITEKKIPCKKKCIWVTSEYIPELQTCCVCDNDRIISLGE